MKNMKKIFFIVLVLFISSSAFPCKLTSNEVIKVGCSFECDFISRLRIMLSAMRLGYKVEFIMMNRHQDVQRALSEVDAVLIPGGADIDPKYYWDSISEELREFTKKNLDLVHFSQEGIKRDPFEYSLVKTYSSQSAYKKLPLLGICRGMQMMSVAQGIPLYLDLEKEVGLKNRYHKFDKIMIDPTSDSLIHSLYRSNSFRGFKFHHQGLRVSYYEENKSQYPLVNVTAYSHDKKIAEAIEYVHRPAFGIQYHPEKSFPGTAFPVFNWFLTKACEYKNQLPKD